MKKIIVIGDVHGRDNWKEQVGEEADLYIFIGDYFDSFDIDGETQINNFKDILQFYNDNVDKVVLLVGNHDVVNYCMDDFFGACSGFQNKYAWIIRNLLLPLYQDKTLKACKVIDKHIFTHAGITKEWCKRYNIKVTKDIEQQVNDLFYKDLTAFCFQDPPKTTKLSQYRYADGYGDNTWQGPFWVRPNSLLIDKLNGYAQIVGHTPQNNITLKKNVWFIDTHNEEKLTLNIN